MGIIKKFRIKSFKENKPFIRLEKISFSYDKRQILDNISFNINEGERYYFDSVDIKKKIENCKTLQEVEVIRLEYLGKKGLIPSEMKLLSKLPIDQKKIKGAFAIAEILKGMGFWWMILGSIISIPPFSFAAGAVYSLVAKNRKRFGNSCS